MRSVLAAGSSTHGETSIWCMAVCGSSQNADFVVGVDQVHQSAQILGSTASISLYYDRNAVRYSFTDGVTVWSRGLLKVISNCSFLHGSTNCIHPPRCIRQRR